MEDLFRNKFTIHYGLPFCATPNISLITNELYFEIEDTSSKDIVLHIRRGDGMANFSNPNRMSITIISYDKFISNLPSSFQDNLKRCDVVLSCDEYFVLGELKDRNIGNRKSGKNVRSKAKKQLFQSLSTIVAVPELQDYINAKSVKRCCYFNKQSKSPITITATTAFNRLTKIFPNGFKMSHSGIEALNFEFWEYTGEQTMTFG